VGACGDLSLFHDGHDTSPGRGAGPGPQRLIKFLPPTAALDFGKAVHHVERIQQGGGNRYGAVHARAAFFETFCKLHLAMALIGIMKWHAVYGTLGFLVRGIS
jgi:hypothetical protein